MPPAPKSGTSKQGNKATAKTKSKERASVPEVAPAAASASAVIDSSNFMNAVQQGLSTENMANINRQSNAKPPVSSSEDGVSVIMAASSATQSEQGGPSPADGAS